MNLSIDVTPIRVQNCKHEKSTIDTWPLTFVASWPSGSNLTYHTQSSPNFKFFPQVRLACVYLASLSLQSIIVKPNFYLSVAAFYREMNGASFANRQVHSKNKTHVSEGSIPIWCVKLKRG